MLMSNAIANTVLPKSDRGQIVNSVRWACDIAVYVMHKTLTFNQLYGFYHVYDDHKKNDNQTEQFHLGSGNAKKRNTKSMY